MGRAFADGGPQQSTSVDILDSNIRLGAGNELVDGTHNHDGLFSFA